MNIFYDVELRTGTNKINIFPSSALGVDYNFVLPSTAPSNNFFLVWNTASNSLVWADTSDLSSPSTESPTFTLNVDLGAGDAPTENCSLIVNRGSATDAAVQWSETTDQWEIGLVGALKPVATSYYRTFTNSDLVASVLTTTHNLGEYTSVTVLDNSNIEIGMSPTHTSVNAFTLDFTRVGTITGTWKIKVVR